MTRHRMRVAVAVAAAAWSLATLTACTGPRSSDPAPVTTVTTPTPQTTATADPADGTAAEDRALFDATNKAVIAAHSAPGGRDFIDALVAAGFDRSAMQVTPDRTSLGYKVGSVQFSVLIGTTCLIGQYGPGHVGYHSLVAPELSTGRCLVGRTRAIDW